MTLESLASAAATEQAHSLPKGPLERRTVQMPRHLVSTCELRRRVTWETGKLSASKKPFFAQIQSRCH